MTNIIRKRQVFRGVGGKVVSTYEVWIPVGIGNQREGVISIVVVPGMLPLLLTQYLLRVFGAVWDIRIGWNSKSSELQ